MARKADIWTLIDPDSANVPEPLKAPIQPTPAAIKAGATTFAGFTPEEHGSFRLLTEMYIPAAKKYDKKSDALAEMCVKIQKLVDRKHLTYTFGATGPYEMLVKLKERFAPTTYGREREILAKWNKLQKPRSQDLEMWLQEYETVFYDCVKYNVSADVKGEKAFHSFVNSISLVDYDWALAQEIRIAGDKEPDYDVRTLIQQYRIYRENSVGLQKPRGSHGAFATFQGKQSDGKIDGERRPCVCGLSSHPLENCYYLVEAKRPTDWKPRADIQSNIQKKIDEVLAGPQDSYVIALQKVLDDQKKPQKKSKSKNRGRSKTQRSSSKSNPSADSDQSMMAVYTTTAMTTASDYELSQSFILDSGATLHVCNQEARFTDLRSANGQTILTGGQSVAIIAFGDIFVNFQKPNGETRRTIMRNVAFVPDFPTSVISLTRLMEKGVQWNTEIELLTLRKKPYARTVQHCGQWTVEYIATERAAFPAHSSHTPKATLQGTTDQWHRRMGHLYPKAIEHLPQSCSGAKLLPSTPEMSEVCETCRLSDATNIVSRRSVERATTPYHKVHWDLIQMKEGLGGMVQILHFVDDMLRMNHIYVLPNRKQQTIVNTIQKLLLHLLHHRLLRHHRKAVKRRNQQGRMTNSCLHQI